MCATLAGCASVSVAAAPRTTASGSATTSSADPSGTTSSPGGGPVRIVGLGDSVTAGTNCHCTDFVSQYATGYAREHHVRTTSDNLGSNGATTTSLAEDLADDAATRRDVARSDVVLVTIGANDLVPLIARWQSKGCGTSCSAPAVTAMGNGLDTVLRRIVALRAGQPTTILVTDYWNVFEDGQVAVADYGRSFAPWSDQVTREANATIRSAAERSGAVAYVDLYRPFKGDGSTDDTHLLASDGDHPDAAGTALIARTLLAATPARPTSG